MNQKWSTSSLLVAILLFIVTLRATNDVTNESKLILWNDFDSKDLNIFVTCLLKGDAPMSFIMKMIQRAKDVHVKTDVTEMLVISHLLSTQNDREFREFTEKSRLLRMNRCDRVFNLLFTSGYWVQKPIANFMSRKIFKNLSEVKFLSELMTNHIKCEKQRLIESNKFTIHGAHSYFEFLYFTSIWLGGEDCNISRTELIKCLEIYYEYPWLIFKVLSESILKLIHAKKFAHAREFLKFADRHRLPPTPEFLDPNYIAKFDNCPNLLRSFFFGFIKKDPHLRLREKLVALSGTGELNSSQSVELMQRVQWNVMDEKKIWRESYLNLFSFNIYESVGEDPENFKRKEGEKLQQLFETVYQIGSINDRNYLSNHCAIAALRKRWDILCMIMDFMECKNMVHHDENCMIILEKAISCDRMENIISRVIHLSMLNTEISMVTRCLMSCIYQNRPDYFKLVLKLTGNDEHQGGCHYYDVPSFLLSMLLANDLSTIDDGLYREYADLILKKDIEGLNMYESVTLKERNIEEIYDKNVEDERLCGTNIFEFLSVYDSMKMRAPSTSSMEFVVKKSIRLFNCCIPCMICCLSGLASRLAITGLDDLLNELVKIVSQQIGINSTLELILTSSIKSAINGCELRVLLKLSEWTKEYGLLSQFLADKVGDMIIANPGIEKDLLQYSKEMGIKISVNEKALKFLINKSSMCLTDLMGLTPLDYKLDSFSVSMLIIGI